MDVMGKIEPMYLRYSFTLVKADYKPQIQIVDKSVRKCDLNSKNIELN